MGIVVNLQGPWDHPDAFKTLGIASCIVEALRIIASSFENLKVHSDTYEYLQARCQRLRGFPGLYRYSRLAPR